MTKPYYRSTPNWVGSYSFNQEKILTIDNFGGGMNNVDADSVIKENESENTQNMMFISGSLMQKRYGTVYLDQTAYPDITKTVIENGNPVVHGIPITWIDEYKPLVGDSKYIEATDEAFYVGGQKICNVSGRVHGVNYLGKYYFVDGKNLFVYNGNAYYKIIEQPIAKLTQALTTPTNTIYVDKIPVTLKVNDPIFVIASDGTTKQNTVSAIDVQNKKITLTNTSSLNLAVGHTIMFFIPNPTSQFVGNEVYDDANHYAYYAPCMNELKDTTAGLSYIPNSPNVITVHKDRIFIAGDTTQPHGVYLSSTVQPLYYPVNIGLGVKPNGDSIIDLIVFDDALIIGRHNDMYVLYGSSELTSSGDEFKIKPMDVSIGFMSTDCGAMLNNYYIYMGYDGRFYKLNSPTTFVEYLMTRPLDWKIDIYSEPFNISKTEELQLSTVAYSNEVFFTINKDLTLVYNFDNQAWTFYTGSDATSRFTDGIKMVIGRSDGKLTKLDTSGNTWNDLDRPIEAKYVTKKFDIRESASYKYFKSFMLTSEAWNSLDSRITVNAEVDLYFMEQDEYTILSRKSLFGYTKFGEIFNDKNLHKSKWLNLDVRGRTIKFTILNSNSNEPFRIYDINVLYSNRDVR